MGLLVHGGPARRQFTEPSPKVCEFFHLHAFASWPSKALHGLRIFFSSRVYAPAARNTEPHVQKPDAQSSSFHIILYLYIGEFLYYRYLCSDENGRIIHSK